MMLKILKLKAEGILYIKKKIITIAHIDLQIFIVTMNNLTHIYIIHIIETFNIYLLYLGIYSI